MSRQKTKNPAVVISNKDRYPGVNWLESPKLAGSVGTENLFLLGYDPMEFDTAVIARSHSDEPTELHATYLYELMKFSQDGINLTIDI